MWRPLGAVRPTKPDRTEAGRWAKRFGALARSLAVATLLAASLMIGLSLARTSSTATVCACGLGNTVTMVANGAPALAYAPPNDATDAPAGIFALDYYANKPVTFDEDLSRMPSAPDPSSVQWRWDFGDGSAYSYVMKPTHTFTTPGTYTIVVSVFEPVSGQWGIFDNAIMHVIATPFANPPVAQARALTSTVIGEDGKITFDGTGSHAVVGSSLSYSWNLGDNTVVSGVRLTHTFKQAGRGFVTLTVTDARGAKAIAQVPVVIILTAQPAIAVASPATAPIGTTINFDASKTQPPADEPVAVAWDFGDGTPLVTTSTPTVAHTYTRPGAYTVTVGVYGQLGDGGVTTIKVTALALKAASTSGGSHQAINWLPIGGGALVALLALAAGLAFWLNQRKRAALIRQRQMAVELARARRVNGGQQRPRAPLDGRDVRREGGPPTGARPYDAPPRRERQPTPPQYDDRRR